MHATVMYRRSVFESVGGFDTFRRACEDYDLHLRIARDFPICCHDKVVAEYRQHGLSMSHDPGLMLKTSLAVLRSQWPYVTRDRRYKEAFKTGVRSWKDYYGAPLAREVLDHVREGEWKRAIWDLLVLLRYRPRVFGRAWKKLRPSVRLRG